MPAASVKVEVGPLFVFMPWGREKLLYLLRLATHTASLTCITGKLS